MNEMTDFPFTWQLELPRGQYHPTHYKRDCPASTRRLNNEWTLLLSWSKQFPYKPEFLEICRRTPLTKEILVSGTFKLMRDAECVLQRKFIQLIEAGYETTPIELEYSDQSSNKKPKYSMTGTLTIPAEVEHKANRAQFESLLSLSIDFEGLLDPKTTRFSDVHLECEADSFSAHKSILSARSPVFDAMFTTEMKENLDNKVVIKDISPRIQKIMLSYIYTGKTGDLCFETAVELLFAADKYQLRDLRRVCSSYLKNCMSSQNVLNTLVLGHLHDQDLEVFATDFICNSSEEFEVMEKTVEWMTLREERPSLAVDILTSLVKSKDKKLKARSN